MGRYFSQWVKYASDTLHTFWGDYADGNHLYDTSYGFSAGHLNMYIDNTLWDSTTFDPAANIWTAPWDSEFLGETHHAATDMPGISVGHVHFSYVLYRSSRTSGWINLPYAYPYSADGKGKVNSRYHQYLPSNSAFNIWTDPL